MWKGFGLEGSGAVEKMGSERVGPRTVPSGRAQHGITRRRAPVPRAPGIRPLLPLGRLPRALVRLARGFLHEPLQQHGPRVDADEPALVTRPRRRLLVRSRRPGLPALAIAGAGLSWSVRRHGGSLVPTFRASTVARQRAVDARPRPDPSRRRPGP